MKRNLSFLIGMILMTTATMVHAGAGGSEAIRIGSDKQLFLGPWTADGRDAFLVESMTNVTMTTNPAHVSGENLVELDRPWEGDRILDLSMFVFKDRDTFRMYYRALPKYPKLWVEPNCRVLCYQCEFACR